jgi:cell division septation protein DedD
MEPTGDVGKQLELFDVRAPATPQAHREASDRWLVALRYDHALLAAMAGIMGVTVVFACGVERGRRLARVERIQLARSAPVAPGGGEQTPHQPPEEAPAQAAWQRHAPLADRDPTAPSQRAPQQHSTRIAGAAPAPERASASARLSRYAVQVITYSRLAWAKREMERLRSAGEQAFLVTRNGRISVYVGPFPSKANAADKLAALKPRYQDCFVRRL